MRLSRKALLVVSALWAVTVLVALGPGLLYRAPQLPRPSLGYPLRPRTLIILLATPFVYAFIYQQGHQSFPRMMLDASLMEEDFELPHQTDLPGLDPADGSWSTVMDVGNMIYHQGNIADKKALSVSTTDNLSRTDYRFNVDVKLCEDNAMRVEGGALLLFRYQRGDNYYFLYMNECQGTLELRSHGNGTHIVESVDCELLPDRWHNVSIVVIGDVVDVKVDGVSYFDSVDMGDSFSQCSLAIGTSHAEVFFSNIFVEVV